MLRFAVHDERGPTTDWPLLNAHLLGAGDLAIPGEITFEDGHIVCRKRPSHTVALSLLHDAGTAGRLMLQTCLLPDRDRPYSLTVELARHRIKMFIAKTEEWQLFDLDPEHSAMRRWERARAIFSEALTLEDPLERARAARRSLTTAIEATERLALAHADILLHYRFASRPASPTTLGVRLGTDRDSKPLRDIVKRDFDLVYIPINWSRIEVEEGKFLWEPIDRAVEWARRERKPIVLGPLVDFSKRSLPKWMYVWQHDFGTCRDMVYEQVERVVQRYRSFVAIWNVTSGLNANDNFQFTSEQMLDLTRTANVIARQARKGARTMIEVAQPFGEHVARRKHSIAPLTFVDRCVQEGIRLDCTGVQLLFGGGNGRTARDLAAMSDLLDRCAFLEMPVLVSAMGVPDAVTDESAGWWHDRWTPELQTSWSSRAFAIAMSKPFVESVIWSDLYDGPTSELARAGMVSETGHPKPILARLIAARRKLKKPLGPPKERLRKRRDASEAAKPAANPSE